jgi:hypothetical protein
LFFLYNLKMKVKITVRFVGWSHGPRLYTHIRIRPNKKHSKKAVAVSGAEANPPGTNLSRMSHMKAKAEAPEIHFQKASGSQSESEYTQKNREPLAILSFLSRSLLTASRRATSRSASKVLRRD